MKKIYANIGILLSIALIMSNLYSQNSRFVITGSLINPLSDFKNEVAKEGLGIGVYFDNSLTDDLFFRTEVAFHDFGEKTVDNRYYGYSTDVAFLPISVGFNYKFLNEFYFGSQFGVYLPLQDYKKTEKGIRPIIGTRLSKFDCNIGYNLIFSNKTIKYLNISLGYAFVL